MSVVLVFIIGFICFCIGLLFGSILERVKEKESSIDRFIKNLDYSMFDNTEGEDTWED